jgi:protein tyrosine phosphatase (PTP) superfamily phosphohydrolase (DUF442 family)
MVVIRWIINDLLAHAPYPRREDLDDLYREGIRAIISLERRPDRDLAVIRGIGFDYLEVPVRDFSAPTVEQLDEINAFIDRKREAGEPVLIHCFQAGRSGTALAGYLIHQGSSFEMAVRGVRSRIPGARAIETDEQMEILMRYAGMQKD